MRRALAQELPRRGARRRAFLFGRHLDEAPAEETRQVALEEGAHRRAEECQPPGAVEPHDQIRLLVDELAVLFLALAQRGFGALARRDVARDADQPRHPPFGIAHRMGALGDPQGAAVGRGHPQLEIEILLALERLDQRGVQGGPVVGMHELDERRAEQGSGGLGVAEESREPIGNEDGVGREIPLPDHAVRGALSEHQALLAIAQMPPGVPVAAVGVDNARNAALLAARILGVG